MAFFQALPWHEGEEKIHKLTRVPIMDNPTSSRFPSVYGRRLAVSPTVALGTVDADGKVWCTIWGGNAPIAQQVAAGGVIGVRTQIDASFDPVAQVLYQGKQSGEVIQHELGKGPMVSGLSIFLEERDRVKLYGTMLAGCLEAKALPDQDQSESKATPGRTGSAQLVLKIDQSLGNCPKYINKKTITAYPDAKPRLISSSPLLSADIISHVHTADTIFVASKGPTDMDCNIRGGPSGFVRVQQPTAHNPSPTSTIIWPEYSGNNLYQTLGNISYDPHVGIVIPNFVTGTVLYISGTAEILLDKAATSVITKSRLAIRLTVTDARFVEDGLTFRGTPCTDNRDVSSSNPTVTRTITDGQSPYNPRVRYLTSELDTLDHLTTTTTSFPPNEYRDRANPRSTDDPQHATLTSKEKLTPTISRYTFRINKAPGDRSKPNTPLWLPGQHVALDFSEDLYMGYSHMNDAEPTSLNDDFVRTFTVSSLYSPSTGSDTSTDFQLVIRDVGVVTGYMSHQRANGTWKVEMKGFGGEFRFDSPAGQGQAQQRNVFIAAGIGITPLLGQATMIQQIDDTSDVLPGLSVIWTLNIVDINLAADVLASLPKPLKARLSLFVTGANDPTAKQSDLATLGRIEEQHNIEGVRVHRRRLTRDDLLALEENTSETHADTSDDQRAQPCTAHGGPGIANWYLCTAPKMRAQLQEWLGARAVVYENFDY